MLSIIVVNLKRMFKDKKVLISILIVPVIITFLFGMIMPSEEATLSIELGLVDYANSNESRYIIDQLTKDSIYNVKMMGEEELSRLLEDNYIGIGIILPKNLKEAKSAHILKSDNNYYQVVQNKLNNILKELTLLRKIPNKNEKNDIHINYINHYSSTKMNFTLGFFINYMMFSMVYICYELIELKKYRILRRSYTMSQSSFSLLGGIMLSIFLLLVIQIIILNLFSYILYKEFLISTLGGIALFLPFILVILGIGIILAKVIKNPDLTALIANLIIIPTGIVSGTFLPRQMLPSFLGRFSFLSPQYWVFNGIEKLNQGLFFEILPNTLILILLALCLLTASSYNFKEMLQE